MKAFAALEPSSVRRQGRTRLCVLDDYSEKNVVRPEILICICRDLELCLTGMGKRIVESLMKLPIELPVFIVRTCTQRDRGSR